MSVFVRLAIAVVLLLTPAAASAQRATTGTVTGKVVDSSGAVLPGATITLQSSEALGQFTAISDANGSFRIANLPPATYDMKAELSGFQTLIRKETVRLNGVLDVEFTLSVGSVAETVTVIGQSPIVDPERAGLSVNISNKALTSVPVTTNRRFQDAWLVVPGVAINPATLELTGSERRTSMDGADVTDPYGGDIFSVNLNYDAVQEVEIKALGAEAADGSSMVGQFMNIVTKSGGNDLHGSAAFFMIPQSFNTSNVSGIAANQRKDFQPDTTLGGPIMRNKVWFFGSYRRVQRDQTFNNAPVPVQNRGNLWFLKVTTQLNNNQRLQVSVQYDRVIQENAVVRGLVGPGPDDRIDVGRDRDQRLGDKRSADANRQSFGVRDAGQRRTAGQLQLQLGDELEQGVSVRRQLHVQQAERLPAERQHGAHSDEGDSEQPDGKHPRQLDHDRARRRIRGHRHLASLDDLSVAVDDAGREPSRRARVPRRRGSVSEHRERHAARRRRRSSGTSVRRAPPAARTCSSSGISCAASTGRRRRCRTRRTSMPTRRTSRIAGSRRRRFRSRRASASRTTESSPRTARKCWARFSPTGVPTNTSDEEFHQWVTMPNFGIAYNAEHWGVFRATANRGYEWLDLGGGDGTSHAPYVLATDVFRANPAHQRYAQPEFARRLSAGAEFRRHGRRQHPQRTHLRERVLGQLGTPAAAQQLVQHHLRVAAKLGLSERRRFERHPQSDDGRAVGRPFPQYDTIRNTYNPNYTWQEQRSLQFLFTRNFVGSWGMNANYSYIMASTFRTRWNPTSDTLQFYGISPEDVTSQRTAPRNHGRVSTFVRLPFDTTFSAFYIYTGSQSVQRDDRRRSP